ncbi:MAG TPA: RluA family pseudouridine synthase [Candidatus Babeliales bacterium]|jgi:23S rRNA pseudouridine1911/1915/1917 synthase|nr:RluA family pseudouridine synthase [Candidatus Babeliales bacterium]
MKEKELVAPHSLFNFIKEPNTEPIRLDHYITQQFPLYSRSFFKKLIEESFVSINDTIVRKQGTLLYPGDTITVQFPGQRVIEPESIEARNLSIEPLATHDHFFIIFKPAGLLVHPPHTNSGMVTLMDWLVHTHKELESVGYIDRPGIVHRLDKDTSGIMVIPRTPVAHTFFSQAFQNRTIHKVYHAVVEGHPPKEGVIDFPIGRHPEFRTKMHAFAQDYPIGGAMRSATTYYHVLAYFETTSLVELKPITGRTHQIRVHCAAIGHPLISDPVYGKKSKKIKRHALHAHKLSFNFLGTDYIFTAPYPEDFAQLLADERTNTQA